MMFRYLILIAIVLSSCSPIKRHNRIVKKFPYVHTVDSVVLIDTVRIKTDAVYSDTVTLIERLKDTVTIQKDNLKVRVYTIKDSVYINGKCDTIFIDKIIERTIPVVHTKANPFKYWWIILVLTCIYLYFRKR